MEDAESELKRRRERGRSSQAAFRKRQAKAIDDTKDENRRLKEALRSIINVTRADDRPELVAVIKDAAGNAGIEAEHLAPSESDSDSNQGSIVEAPASAHLVSVEASQLQCRVTTPQSSSSTSTDEIDAFVKRTGLGRANSGAWVNPFHYMALTDPPEDIIPYLGDTQFTLAGKIFWAVLEQGQAAFRYPYHSTSWDDSVEPGFRKIMSHSRPLITLAPGTLKSMVDARLQFRKHGCISSELAVGVAMSPALRLHKMVVEDYLSRGKDPNLFLTPFAVEWRVRAILGSTLFDMLQAAARTPDSSTAHQSVMAVVTELVNNFVCFGDGPRWAVGAVDTVISEWVNTVKS